ncbi:type IV secretory system conjugative DNA transfer family protein [Campylobacter coli]|nr:type IV secretory system conjugative DNA transfer family protein [Campylobacter jejuni]EDP7298773.1 TraM recognition domain-containing protein [Campylobacter jejuni]EGS0795697.1 type IV secretory system conjugative DNA transfer family protein [Campylobacter coli]HDZ4368572.1 type IV secretory system conjugative DNA transfer family protein [Campylobacter jejuni]HDZ4376990.1 type IV secretory system conjugative DNA transfer family protein [Campylobacter jejuni]
MKDKIVMFIFISIFSLLIAYFLSPFAMFYLNDVSLKRIFGFYNLKFTFEALINAYPKAYVSFFGMFGFSVIVLILLALIAKSKKTQFGEARFANLAEIKKMKLFSDNGIIIGKYKGKFLRFKGPQFVALGAPTRSGKGVGIVIPNLMDWKESAVVQDIKQECFDFTSKYRKEILGQDVFLFNPFSKRTHRYNPLTYIDMSDSDNCDSQLMDLANIIYPKEGDSTTQFFNGLAQNLFIGLCYLWKDLNLREDGKLFLETFNLKTEFSFFGILQLSKGFTFEHEGKKINGFDNTYKYLSNCDDLLSDITKRRLETYFSISSDNTKSGVMSSFNEPLTPFEAEVLKLSTQVSDFDLRDLRKKKMTIYIGITPDQLTNAKFILNIFWSQLILLNTKELPEQNPQIKYTCLMLMDEFTAPRKIPIYLSAVSFMAGYLMRSLMIYQSKSQLKAPAPDGYGDDGAKTLLTNHACQIFYTPREQEDAEEISRILGNTTFKTRSRSIGASGGSTSYSEASRALMLPQELREMSFEDELITIDNGKPILCKKAFYYNDPYFIDKFKQVSPTLAKIKGIPKENILKGAFQRGECRIQIPTTGENNEKNA